MTTTSNVLINELRATERGFLTAVQGLSIQQWNFQAGPEVWSIAQVAEHVTVVEIGVARMVTQKLLTQPATPEQRASLKGRDGQVTAMMFDRSVLRPAPEFVRPTGRWADPAEAIRTFTEARDGLVVWLSKTDVDLRAHCAEHPSLGLLDGKQWLLFAAAHCERHTRQIGELKTRPGFPGS